MSVSTALGESFTEIRESVESVTKNVQDIASATNEQAQGVDQVNIAVAQMDKVTQNNSANAEESAAAAKELSSQATQMRLIVGDLTRIVDGNASQSGGKAPALEEPSHFAQERIAPFSSTNPSAKENRSHTAAPKREVKTIPPSEIIPLDENDVF